MDQNHNQNHNQNQNQNQLVDSCWSGSVSTFDRPFDRSTGLGIEFRLGYIRTVQDPEFLAREISESVAEKVRGFVLAFCRNVVSCGGRSRTEFSFSLPGGGR